VGCNRGGGCFLGRSPRVPPPCQVSILRRGVERGRKKRNGSIGKKSLGPVEEKHHRKKEGGGISIEKNGRRENNKFWGNKRQLEGGVGP